MKLSKSFAALLGTLALPTAMAGVYPQCPSDVTALGTDSVDPATGLTLRKRNTEGDAQPGGRPEVVGGRRSHAAGPGDGCAASGGEDPGP